MYNFGHPILHKAVMYTIIHGTIHTFISEDGRLSKRHARKYMYRRPSRLVVVML